MVPDFVAKAILDGSQQVFIPFNLQVGVQAALHQNTGTAQIDGFLNLVEDHILRMHVAFLVAHGTVEGAETAILSAKIGVVDISVYDVAHHAVRMQLAAHRVSGHPNADQIVAVINIDCFLARHHTETFFSSTRLRSSEAYCKNISRPAYSRSPSWKTMLSRR